MAKTNKNIQFILVYFPEIKFFASQEFEHPNALLVLESLLKKHGISSGYITTCSFKDLLKEQILKKMASEIGRNKAVFIICFRSFKILMTSSIFNTNINLILKTAYRIKSSFSNSLVALSGAKYSNIFPKSFMKDKLIDIIILGEIETVIKHLIKSINQKELQPIPGAHVLKNGEYIYGGKRRPALPQEIYQSQKMVLEARKEESEQEKQQKFLTLEFSRGCYFNCFFCINQLIKKNLELNPAEYVRYVSPENAVKTLKTARDYGFKKIFILSENSASFCRDWAKKFLVKMKEEFQKNIPITSRIYLQFNVSPIDFQKDWVVNFFKKLSSFFIVRLDFGFEAFDKETLLGLDKPHKNGHRRVFRKILEAFAPLEQMGVVSLHFSIIHIHPWINFRKYKNAIKMVAKFPSQKDLWIINKNNLTKLCLISKELRIVEKLKKAGLFLRVGRNPEYKFKYAKKALFPKDENDTDIYRFASFLDELYRRKSAYESKKFEDSLKAIEKIGEKIKIQTRKKIFQFFMRVIDEAEKEWHLLTYEDYKKRCRKKISELLEITSIKNIKKITRQ